MNIRRVLKIGITRVGNPYTPGIAWGNRALELLDHVFIQHNQVFEGDISDLVQLGNDGGISEHQILADIREMAEDSRWVTISGNIFTPGEWLLERYR